MSLEMIRIKGVYVLSIKVRTVIWTKTLKFNIKETIAILDSSVCYYTVIVVDIKNKS